MVAPLAGAWIEIVFYLQNELLYPPVAPLAGAWIEIRPLYGVIRPLSRSPRGSVD